MKLKTRWGGKSACQPDCQNAGGIGENRYNNTPKQAEESRQIPQGDKGGTDGTGMECKKKGGAQRRCEAWSNEIKDEGQSGSEEGKGKGREGKTRVDKEVKRWVG